MAFEWREYLALARWLQANTPPGMTDECARRAALGRAYYAAFKYAVEYATAYLGFVPRNNGDDHGRCAPTSGAAGGRPPPIVWTGYTTGGTGVTT